MFQCTCQRGLSLLYRETKSYIHDVLQSLATRRFKPSTKALGADRRLFRRYDLDSNLFRDTKRATPFKRPHIATPPTNTRAHTRTQNTHSPFLPGGPIGSLRVDGPRPIGGRHCRSMPVGAERAEIAGSPTGPAKTPATTGREREQSSHN